MANYSTDVCCIVVNNRQASTKRLDSMRSMYAEMTQFRHASAIERRFFAHAVIEAVMPVNFNPR